MGRCKGFRAVGFRIFWVSGFTLSKQKKPVIRLGELLRAP